MKINNLRIKAFLLSALPFIFALPLSAQVLSNLTDDQKLDYYEIVAYANNDSATGTLGQKPGSYFASILQQLDADDKVIMDVRYPVGSSDEFLLPTQTISVGEIYVENWTIFAGDNGQEYVINSAITGDGTIYINSLLNNATTSQTYQFSGDMSNYGGRIQSSIRQGLTIEFTGSARGSLVDGDVSSGTGGGVAGRGSISAIGGGGEDMSVVAFSLDKGKTSYVTNTYIYSDHIQFNNTSYAVAGDIYAFHVLSLGSEASVTMLADSSLALANGASFNSGEASSLTFDSGSRLGANHGLTIDATVVMESGVTLTLKAGDATSLTLSNFTWTGGTTGSLNLSVNAAPSFIQGKTYNLLNMDMTGLSTSNFSVTMDGLSSENYELSINDNILTATIIKGAYELSWRGGNEAIWSSSDTSQLWNIVGGEGTSHFRSNDIMRFETASEARTVQISGNVAPGAVIVDSDSDYTFSGDGSMIGSSTLTKLGTGRLTVNTSNFTNVIAELHEGTLSVSALDLYGAFYAVKYYGGTLAVHGGGTKSFATDRIDLNGTGILKLELDGTNLTLQYAMRLQDHKLHVTARDPSATSPLTLSHDSWEDILGVHVGAGVIVDFGETIEKDLWLAKGLSGSGTLVSSNSQSVSSFVVATSSEDGKFTGTIDASNDANIGIALTHDDANSRMSLIGSADTLFSIYNKGSDTLYLKSLSGEAVFSFADSPSGDGRRTVDLEMQEDQTFGGVFEHDAANMGNFVVSSASDASPFALTLSGTGYATNSLDENWHQMHVSNAVVTLSGQNATWGGVIDLKDEQASLVFDHSEAHLRTAESGKITGAGSVEIVSTHGVTLSGENSYSGGTTVGEAATLTLKSAAAAGTGEIRLKDGATLDVVEGVSLENALSLSGSNTVNGRATFSGDISLEGNASLTATSPMTLSGRFNGDAGEVLTLESGTFNFSHASIDVSSLSIADGAHVIIENSTFTEIDLSAPKNQEFTPLSGAKIVATVYTLHNIAHLLAAASGETVLDLGSLDGYQPGGITAFEIAGLTSLSLDSDSIRIMIGGKSYQLLGMTTTGLAGSNNVVLYYDYIPEPSAGALSLLALTGLLARRRRRKG